MAARLIVFDLDGTLIDSRADLAAAVNDMRIEFGLEPLPVPTVAGYVGDGIRLLTERALQGAPVDVEAAVARTRAAYGRRLVERTTLYPGVAAALDDLQALGYRLAVVTNKPHEFTVTLLGHFGLLPRLAAVLGGGATARLKPHPEPILRALAAAGCEADGSWMVGDHHTDLAAGRAAGLRTCFCTYGFGQRGEQTADLTVASLAELVEHVRGAVPSQG